jgi:oxalate---CoA ligase
MAARRRLDHIDAMRPLKQAGVVGTHTIVAFTPVTALVFSNGALLLLHVSREAFFAISACMLTYAYSGLKRDTMRKFYWRRFIAVGIPYLAWNLIYFFWFLYVVHETSYASAYSAMLNFFRQLEVGYDQLYFLIVIAEFYLLFPLVLWLLRKTAGHHGLLMAVVAVLQVAMTVGLHWSLLPYHVVEYAQENAFSYLLYLIGGAVVAVHLSDVHDWLMRNALLVAFGTVATAIFAEGVYFLTKGTGSAALGDASDPFQPSVIPFNVCVIALGYLAGMWLVHSRRHRWIRAATRVGSDDSYGIFLAQMIFITALADELGWRHFASVMPFIVWLPLTIAIAYLGSIVLTEVLARTPLAVPLTGRKQVPWRTPPRREAAAAAAPAASATDPTAVVTVPAFAAAPVSESAPAPAPAPAARGRESTTLARAGEQNGALPLLREWIDQNAAARGDAPYLEDAAGSETLTYAGLARSVRAWCRLLDDAGIAPGTAVAIRWPEPFGYAAALAGILGAGRVAVPLDPGAPGADVARVLAVARPQALVGDSADGLPGDLPVLKMPNEDAFSDPDFVPPLGAGIYLCTSGTTGTPKGILLGEEQLAHVAAAVASHHRLTPADRGYCCLPLFHVNAEVVGVLSALAAGACLIVDRKFRRRGFWELIEARQATWINAVPAIITILGMDPLAAPLSGRIRFIRSASAPLAPAALLRFEETFGIPVVETYGMTEAASMITANPLDGPRKAGSAGLPAGSEVRVVEFPDGSEGPCLPCPAGTVGRVQIRGGGVITRYAANGRPGAIDADGWLDTGDLGHLDSDGYLFLAGRSDDVINRGGEKIYPREIEDFLLAQPGVRSVALIGVRDEVLGERPVAYVVPAGSPAPDGLELADALREACEAELPKPKRPAEFCLMDELPLGPTGKIARRRLRELAAVGS